MVDPIARVARTIADLRGELPAAVLSIGNRYEIASGGSLGGSNGRLTDKAGFDEIS